MNTDGYVATAIKFTEMVDKARMILDDYEGFPGQLGLLEQQELQDKLREALEMPEAEY